MFASLKQSKKQHFVKIGLFLRLFWGYLETFVLNCDHLGAFCTSISNFPSAKVYVTVRVPSVLPS